MNYTRLGRNTVNAVRFAEILQVFVRHGFADLLRRAGFQHGLPARLLRGLNLMEAEEGAPETFGARLRAALTELGPTFVKFGQVLSTRPDLVGAKLAGELSSLQDEVQALPFERMAQVIESELNAAVPELFASLDERPVGAASLSQVYRAVTRDGENVAVKVQRPDIEKIIESDLSLMRSVGEWIAEHVEEGRPVDPVGIVDEFTRSIRRELDFAVEARVVDMFAANFEGDDRVVIPRVHHDYSARRVLTLEWVDGVRVDDLEAYPGRNSDPLEVAVLGVEIVCKMVFDDRLFHADPHPGNIFLVGDNRIAFLDLGMAGHLEKGDVAAITELFMAIFRDDSKECVEAILALTTQDEPLRPGAFAHEIAEYLAFEAPAIVARGQLSRGVELIVQIARRHSLELAPRFSLLVKALATIEMVARKLDSNLDVVPILQPHLERIAIGRYAPGRVFEDMRQQLGSLLRLGRQAPGDLSSLMHQLRSGKFRFQVHHEHLENLSNTIDRASKRNAVAMVIAALIVGSSLLVTTEGTMTNVGIAGYILAGVLGLMLIISILWGRGI